MDSFEILVVDDQPMITQMISEFLRGHDYAVDIANDSTEALRMCNRKLYKVIFSDVRMPGMSGLELLKAIKKRQPTAIIFMMTGYHDSEVVVDCLEHGAADFLTKPIRSLKILVEIVEEARRRVERWRNAFDGGSYSTELFVLRGAEPAGPLRPAG